MVSTRTVKYGAVTGLICFGTTTSLFAKIVYEIQSVGRDGEKHFYRKPWAMTTLMFLGMSTCLPLAYWLERKQRSKGATGQAEAEVPLLSDADSDTQKGQQRGQRSHIKEIMLLTIPTFFDLLATILMNIGLLYVTASVYQMMRGAEMLFAALFSITFLGRRLNSFHLGGIGCCVTGVVLVGTSSYLAGQGSAVMDITPEQNLVGMALIVISQAVQAAQLTFEDYFMADLDIPAIKIVGWEGVWGVVGTLGVMAPLAYFMPGVEGEGLHEDILDTAAMIKNSRSLQVILAVDCAALALYNMVGMLVTGHLGAVFRTVLETMRTLFVWLVGLLLFYTPLGLGNLGESWSKYSWLQAAGFVVLVCGTLVYQRGEKEDANNELEEAMAVQAAAEEPILSGPVPMGAHALSIPAGPSLAAYSIPGASVGTPTQPRDMVHGSFKASHTIMSGSYSRGSLGRHQSGPYMRVPQARPPRDT